MRLSALFEEFVTFLRVEQEAAPRSIDTYRWCFRDFEAFTMREIGGTVLVTHFTAERCRAYQYSLAARGLQANSIRVRLATLGSFGKWAVRREKLDRNLLDLLTRPRRKARLPRVPRWDTIERLITESTDPRERALVALIAYGGLRRSEVVALNIGDYTPDFGLRRVQGRAGSRRPSLCPRWRGPSSRTTFRRSEPVLRQQSRCLWCGTVREAARRRSVA